MKLVSHLIDGRDQLAFLVDGLLFDCDLLHPELPNSMNMFLQYWDDMYPVAIQVDAAIKSGRISKEQGLPIEDSELLAPVPFPTSFRGGYAFLPQSATAEKNGNVDRIPGFDQSPVFHFMNHHSIQGPGEIKCMPDHFEKLDFGLEVAIVICKQGRNIPADEADQYIGGLMIMNNMSTGKLLMEEMLLNPGPAKGKDFATAIGPCLVTLDELENYESPCKEGHAGKSWNVSMKCAVNDIEVSNGNTSDMDWTFAEIIERCSYGADLYPGDVIGSGTVGTGSFLELNETGKRNDPNYTEQWLHAGDTVEMEIETLGKLRNILVHEDSDFSILARKKNIS